MQYLKQLNAVVDRLKSFTLFEPPVKIIHFHKLLNLKNSAILGNNKCPSINVSRRLIDVHEYES